MRLFGLRENNKAEKEMQSWYRTVKDGKSTLAACLVLQRTCPTQLYHGVRLHMAHTSRFVKQLALTVSPTTDLCRLIPKKTEPTYGHEWVTPINDGGQG